MNYIIPKLTIELVPKTCWFSNVRSQVSENDWNILKKQSYQKAQYKCEICGGKGNKWPVEAHEIWHYNDKKNIQKLIGLISLCPSCHEVKHIGLAETKGRLSIAKSHLSKINKWNNEEINIYLEAIWEIWYQRSLKKWDLDLSFLDKLNIKYLKINPNERVDFSNKNLTD